MAYRISYSDYPGTDTGPPDPERWIGPAGPAGPKGEKGDTGATGGLSGGTLTGPLIWTATGGTAPRSAQDRAADVINVLDHGAVGNGLTDDAPAIQAAIDHAATFTPPRAVYAPAGTYLIGTLLHMTPVSRSQCLRGDEGGTVFLLGPSNASAPCMLNIDPGAVRATVEGITFDGNAANTTWAATMVQAQTSSDTTTIRHCHFRNSHHSAFAAPGDQPVSVSLNATAAPGQPVITFAALPAGLKAGAYAAGSPFIDGDMYLIAVTATTATFNRPLTDTILNGTGVPFSHAFTTSAAALYGDTVLATADTTGLAVGMTIFIAGNGCFQSYTRITAIVVNASVTIDRFMLNKLPAGSNIAAAMGHSRLTIEGCHFNNIGQSRMTAGSRSYNTVGVAASGSSQLTLKNFGATWAGLIGVYPGQKTGLTGLPAGVPANTLIKDLVVNSLANTHTITLAAPLTASVPDAASIPFQTAVGGAGYGIWHAWGAPFAQIDAKFLNNRFEHTWAACIYAINMRALFMGNFYIQDQMEFKDPAIAPSPCIALGGCVSTRIIGEYGAGATGVGLDTTHSVGLIVSGCEFSGNGYRGSNLNSGHSNIVNGVILNNNGQAVNVPMAVDPTVSPGNLPAGMALSGSGTFGQPGTMSNITVANVIASDTQVRPTQYFGVTTRLPSVFSNYWQGTLIGTGNITAMLDPAVAAGAQANVWTVGATWTQGSGKPSSTQPNGSIWSRDNGPAGKTLYVTRAGRWNPLVEGDGTQPDDGTVLFSSGTSVASAGANTAEETLTTITLPAGTFKNVGDIVHIVAGGGFIGSTDSKNILCRLATAGGSLMCNPIANAVGQTRWVFDLWIMKTGPNAQTYLSLAGVNGNASGSGTLTGAATDTAPILIYLNARNATNAVPGSITLQNYMVETYQ